MKREGVVGRIGEEDAAGDSTIVSDGVEGSRVITESCMFVPGERAREARVDNERLFFSEGSFNLAGEKKREIEIEEWEEEEEEYGVFLVCLCFSVAPVPAEDSANHERRVTFAPFFTPPE